MDKKAFHALVVSIGLIGLIAGCDNNGTGMGNTGARQTKFPGQVSAGGGTSGEVMARADGAKKHTTTTGAHAAQETVRSQAPAGGVAGTPSIPEGAGGTTSGPAMGGTTSGAAASQITPPPGGAAPSIPAQGGQK